MRQRTDSPTRESSSLYGAPKRALERCLADSSSSKHCQEPRCVLAQSRSDGIVCRRVHVILYVQVRVFILLDLLGIFYVAT